MFFLLGSYFPNLLLFVWQATPSILESAISGIPSHINPVIAGAPAQQYIIQPKQASTSQ